MTGGLLEREAELAVIRQRVLDARGGSGGALLIEGQAGIGKSRLVEAAQRAAAGMRVLAARGNEWERGYAYGVMRQLFEPVLRRAAPDERAELLAGAAGLAAAALELTGEPRADSGLAGEHGLYWLTANLAERGPLLLVVDDAHWADTPSLRALGYQLRRLAELPVLVVLGVRTGEPAGSAVAELLDALRDDPATTVLRPSPLSERACAELVRAGLGAHADDRFCAECHRAAAGNPLLLSALVGALAEAGVPPAGDQVDQVWRRAPQIMASFVAPRLRHLPPAAAELIRAVAVLGSGAELRHAAALAGIPTAAAAEAADALAAAELLARGRPLRFSHPLVGQAIFERMTPAQRHGGHLRAARLLAGEDAPAESVAAHLMEAERLGEAWLVERLRDAARAALAKGAPQAAVAYLRRALEEPPPADARPRLLFELGVAQARTEPAEACATLQAALDAATGPRERAMVALELGRVLLGVQDSGRGLPLLERAIVELDGADPELRLRLEAELINAARLEPATRDAAYQRLERLRPAARPSTAAGSALLATLAFHTVQSAGRAAEAVELASAALGGLHALDVDDSEAQLQCSLVLLACDELDTAIAACDQAVERARRHGSGIPLAMAVSNRANAWLRRGSLADAETDGRLAVELADEYDSAFARQVGLAVLIIALVERGTLDEASALADRALDGQVAYPEYALGRLLAAAGRPEEAVAHFRTGGRRLELREFHHPGSMPWRAEAAIALHQLGATPEASELVDEAIAVARRYQAARPLGQALRAAGLVRGDVGLLREAVAALAPTPGRLDHARALVDLGAALRRAGRRAEAREPLRQGLDLAHRCGASVLIERARTELAATGLRPRSPALTGLDALTPSERRVAVLAGAGQTNREIAQQLFVTVKTVEVHLGNAYRKLGIASRTELADHVPGLG